MSDVLNSFLKSADPARTNPDTFGLSAEMKHVVAVSATCMSLLPLGSLHMRTQECQRLQDEVSYAVNSLFDAS